MPQTRRRILFLTPQLPFPPQQGTAIRNYNLISQVAQRHEVHLLSFAELEPSRESISRLSDVCTTLSTVPAPRRQVLQRIATTLLSPRPDLHYRLSSRAMYDKLISVLRRVEPDVVQVEGLEMAQYGSYACRLPPGQRLLLIYDAHNAEHLLQKRIFQADMRTPRRWLAAIYSWGQWHKLRRYEATFCRQASRVLACSAADAETLANLCPGLVPVVAPNGADTRYHRPVGDPTASAAPRLVFTGKMDFRPNIDAVLWFCSLVFPIIRQTRPDTVLQIVGKNPHRRLSPLSDMPGVEVTGFVDDVRPYVDAASVYVAPLLAGGGTRLKVLEAMSMAKAIVSTSLGCESIPVQHGRELLIADTPEAFAQQVISLLDDADRRRQLGAAARRLVVEKFDWSVIAQEMDHVYES